MQFFREAMHIELTSNVILLETYATGCGASSKRSSEACRGAACCAHINKSDKYGKAKTFGIILPASAFPLHICPPIRAARTRPGLLGGALGASMNAPIPANNIEESSRNGTRYCCSGCLLRSCCGWTRASCSGCCSTSHREEHSCSSAEPLLKTIPSNSRPHNFHTLNKNLRRAGASPLHPKRQRVKG